MIVRIARVKVGNRQAPHAVRPEPRSRQQVCRGSGVYRRKNLVASGSRNCIDPPKPAQVKVAMRGLRTLDEEIGHGRERDAHAARSRPCDTGANSRTPPR